MNEPNNKATLFDIQGFSVHDGPGCRTLIFFKGCSLCCRWCSNPEGIKGISEPLYNKSLCTFDGLCAEACPHQAIAIEGTPPDLRIDRSICAGCTTHACAKACCTGALRLGGFEMNTGELYSRIDRDRSYWGSRGGITLSGGEPFVQHEFVHRFLEKCYDAYIHTAVETCGNVPWHYIEPSVPYLDWIFFDLKHMDPEKHRMMTGSANDLILGNALRLANNFNGRLVFRIPVIPGFNDDQYNILQTIDFIKKTGRTEVNILPVHHLGREKYGLVGMEYYTSDFTPPSREQLNTISERFITSGIRCFIGSETPF